MAVFKILNYRPIFVILTKHVLNHTMNKLCIVVLLCVSQNYSKKIKINSEKWIQIKMRLLQWGSLSWCQKMKTCFIVQFELRIEKIKPPITILVILSLLYLPVGSKF